MTKIYEGNGILKLKFTSGVELEINEDDLKELLESEINSQSNFISDTIVAELIDKMYEDEKQL